MDDEQKTDSNLPTEPEPSTGDRHAELRRLIDVFVEASIREVQRRHDAGEIERENIGIIRTHVPSIRYEQGSKGYQSRLEHLTCNRLKREDVERVMREVLT